MTAASGSSSSAASGNAGADDRRDNRRRFVGNAKVELATAPVSARLRVGARRVRGKLLVARYNLRKRLGRDG